MRRTWFLPRFLGHSHDQRFRSLRHKLKTERGALKQDTLWHSEGRREVMGPAGEGEGWHLLFLVVSLSFVLLPLVSSLFLFLLLWWTQKRRATQGIDTMAREHEGIPLDSSLDFSLKQMCQKGFLELTPGIDTMAREPVLLDSSLDFNFK